MQQHRRETQKSEANAGWTRLQLGFPKAASVSLAVLFLVADLTLACGSSSSNLPEAQRIEAILASPIEIAEISADSAVLRVTTNIDVVCSVVFGPDTGYGAQSTDLDMAGRGHSSHNPLLRGLEPDTIYHFRLQGTAADGTLYVSKDMTFRTALTAAAGGESRTNLASLSAGARVVEASSQFGSSGTWKPENALDGDPDSEWSSAGDGDEAFITIELARVEQIGSVGLWTRTMGSSAQITSFRVITEDGLELGPFEVPDGSRMYEFPVSATAQQLRFEVVSSSGGNTGLVEIAVFACD